MYSSSEPLIQLAKKIDDSIDLNNVNKLNGYLNQIKTKLCDLNLDNDSIANLYYYAANIYFHLYSIKNTDKQKNKIESIRYFSKAICYATDRNTLLQLNTNLGNLLKKEHRYFEALYYYQKANDITLDFLLPVGMKLRTFSAIFENYFKDKIDSQEIWRILLLEINTINQLKSPQEHFEQIKGQEIIQSYLSSLSGYFSDYYKTFNEEYNNGIEIESINDSMLKEDPKYLETQYTVWCRNNYFLLNFINLVNCNHIIYDNLTLPPITLKRGDFIIQMWQQLAQEYCSFRYKFYLCKDYEPPYTSVQKSRHTSDKNNSITKNNNLILEMRDSKNLLSIKTPFKDYNFCLSKEIEDLKASYSIMYNIIDKLSVLLISYIKLSNKKSNYIEEIKNHTKIIDDKLNLASFQYIRDIPNLKEVNPYLYSFYSIYEDIVVQDVFNIKIIRDKITHGFLKISYYNSRSSFFNKPNQTIESNLYTINLNEIKKKYLTLINFIRAQFFNVHECIGYIENSK